VQSLIVRGQCAHGQSSAADVVGAVVFGWVLPRCISIAPIPSRSGARVIVREHEGEFRGKGERSRHLPFDTPQDCNGPRFPNQRGLLRFGDHRARLNDWSSLAAMVPPTEPTMAVAGEGAS
jgi:hypothetical protein